MKKLSLVALLYLSAQFGYSQELGYCDFTSDGSWTSNGAIHISDFLGTSSSDVFNNGEWFANYILTGPEISTSRYLSFRISAENCTQFSLDSIHWRSKYQGLSIIESPLILHLRSSQDNFSNDLWSDTVTVNWEAQKFIPSTNNWDSLQVVEFRLYYSDQLILFNGLDPTTNMVFDDFHVYGSTFGADTMMYYLDEDADGYGNPAYSFFDCENVYPYATNGNDCDPTQSHINPATFWFGDNDQDGYFDYYDRIQSCTLPGANYILSLDFNGDCDDSNANVNLFAYESPCPNGLDSNCDGQDEGNGLMPHCDFHMDEDSDGYGNGVVNNLPCCSSFIPNYMNQGYVYFDGFVDCNDQDSTVHPFALEIFGNDVDEDCDGNLVGIVETKDQGELFELFQPTPSVLLISKKDEIAWQEIKLYDIHGRLCYRNGSDQGSLQLNISDWATGLYHVVIKYNGGFAVLKWING
jgi:hypothetical protein